MGTLLQYVSIDDFPMRWRFTEDASRWTVLPGDELRHFKPLSDESSAALWNQTVRRRYGQPECLELLAMFIDQAVSSVRLQHEWTFKDEDGAVSEFLRTSLSVISSSTVYYFWDSLCAVETTWDLIRRYWSDFWYPSDNFSIAWPIESDRFLCFHDVVAICVEKAVLVSSEQA